MLMGAEMKWYHQALIALLFFCCFGALVWNAGSNSAKYQDAKKEVDSQGAVIAKQAFDFNRFNQVSEFTNRNNSLIDASTEKTIIEYREILRREKTCDLPVPADISDGLLEYANRLRASAMYADTSVTDSASNATSTTKRLTYCQAVLWIKPLLAAIEVANNQLAGIRRIEEARTSSQSAGSKALR